MNYQIPEKTTVFQILIQLDKTVSSPNNVIMSVREIKPLSFC